MVGPGNKKQKLHNKFLDNLTSSSTLRLICCGFCGQLSVFPQAFSFPHWQGLHWSQHQITEGDIYIFFFLLLSSSISLTIITNVTILHGSYVWPKPAVSLGYGSLHLFPQLVQLHCKRCEAVHLQAKKFSFYIKIMQNTSCSYSETRFLQMCLSDLGRVGWSGSNSPQQLAPRNHVHSVWSRWRSLLLILTATLQKIQTIVMCSDKCDI